MVIDPRSDLRLATDRLEVRSGDGLEVEVVPDPDEGESSGGPGPGRRITMGIVDDHRVMLDALTSWLRAEAGDLEVAIVATSFPQLVSDPRFPVAVVLLDLDLGDDVPTSARIVELAVIGVAVVVVSTFANPRRVRESIRAGALGYVPKTEAAGEIVRAVRAAAAGETHLTPGLATMLVAEERDDDAGPALSPQEHRALVLYASGLPLKSVARQLDISVETAKTYLTRVREKYAHAGREARTKIALHRRAVEDGLLSGEAMTDGSRRDR